MPVTVTPLLDRLASKIRFTDQGCWEFTGSLGTHGYGRLWDQAAKKPRQAHRLSYELLVGPIEGGLPLDHLCRNRACVNPDHLEPVTHRENVRRGLARQNGEHNRAKTHCPQGHLYDEANTGIVKSHGWRYCIRCNHEKNAANYQLRKASSA